MLAYNGKTVSLSDLGVKNDDLKTLRAPHVFILPDSYKSSNPPEPDNRLVQLPRGIHIPMETVFREGGKINGAEGRLIYYRTRKPMAGMPGEHEYEPLMLPISNGAMHVTGKEDLAFVMLNHQHNIDVTNNPKHPGFVQGSTGFFFKWDPTKMGSKIEADFKCIEIMQDLIYGKNKMDSIALRSFAKSVNASRNLPGISNVDDTDETFLRGKIMLIVKDFPDKMYDIMHSNKASLRESIGRMIEHKILMFSEAESGWAEIQDNSLPQVFLKVFTQEDRMEKLVKFIEENGTQNVRVKGLMTRLEASTSVE